MKENVKYVDLNSNANSYVCPKDIKLDIISRHENCFGLNPEMWKSCTWSSEADFYFELEGGNTLWSKYHPLKPLMTNLYTKYVIAFAFDQLTSTKEWTTTVDKIFISYKTRNNDECINWRDSERRCKTLISEIALLSYLNERKKNWEKTDRKISRERTGQKLYGIFEVKWD